jgi:hypothetical protein
MGIYAIEFKKSVEKRKKDPEEQNFCLKIKE